jgi:hypothetical protein
MSSSYSHQTVASSIFKKVIIRMVMTIDDNLFEISLKNINKIPKWKWVHICYKLIIFLNFYKILEVIELCTQLDIIGIIYRF